MRIRPYIYDKDYEYIEKWIDDEKVHALWCANLIPYPVTKENLHNFLEKSAMDWTDSAYVATESNGKVVGFFCYSINVDDNSGFLKLVIVDNKKRGAGYGKEMLRLALQYAFNITGVDLVRINVFEDNIAAKQCYTKLGFATESVTKDALRYKDECWNRCHMVIGKSSFLIKV
ncbi:MAG: GNAT family N-acetyltransferase [Butyrivibrio sp.]|nr:GNAT family N-acetyltransferase [Butyrivibrio sp.]